MTIKQLKEKIKDVPDLMDVMIKQVNTEGDIDITLAERAEVKKVKFLGEQDVPEENCFVITDDF